MNPWGIHSINDVIAPSNVSAGLPDGQWGYAVPEPYTGHRLRAAWWVLTGRAVALRWPTHEQLNRALGWTSGPKRFSRSGAMSAHLCPQAQREPDLKPIPEPQ